jgi:hypothetical protein
MKTIYIAGPMRGFPRFNFPAFDAARDRLVKEGWNVISPADMDREVGFDEHDKFEPSKQFLDMAFDRDIAAIKKSDAIYMLSGWEGSTGATAEYWLARWLHLSIFQEKESILSIAQRVTTGDRRRDYDKATPNHERIAEAWNWYIRSRKGANDELSPIDIAHMMILLKLARACFTPTKDSYVDIAGYAKCASQIANFEAE